MRQRSKLHWSNVVCRPWAIVVYNVEPTLDQRRNAIWVATRLVPGCDEIPYEERLRRLKLPSLQYRRKIGDMIQTYKIMRGFDRIDPAVFFKFLPSQVTRGHRFKIHKQQSQRLVRSQSYNIRVANDWNNVPADVVNAKSVASFRKNLDNHWKDLQYSTDCC